MIMTIMSWLYSSLLIYIADISIQKFNYKARWFQLHAFINYVIAALTCTDVWDCIKYPDNSQTVYSGKTNMALQLTVLLHIYHCCMFEMRKADWQHHIFGFIAIPSLLNWQKKGTSILIFFINGLPGALDYTFITLYKNQILNKYTVKNMYSYISAYLRLPGGSICAYLLFKDSISTDVILYSPLMLSLFAYLNSSFYGKQAIENYGQYKSRN
jgi:hypothetical protein